MNFCEFSLLAPDLTLCIDWVVPGMMPEVLHGMLVARVVMLVARLMHRHD